MNELISIIIPSYNQAQYLDECLQSVLSQSYENWECIIVNDGSTDNSEEIIEKWLSNDKRFKYLYKENSGVCDTKNMGIENAKGKWILPLDADDYITNDYLKLASEYFLQEETKIIYCEAEFFGTKTGRWNLPKFSHQDFAYNNIIFNSAFFRKSDWELSGGYDNEMIYGMEDWEFWISIIKRGGNVVRIPKVCFFYRIKEESRSAALRRETYDKCFKIIDRKHYLYFHQHLPPYHRIMYDNRDLEKVLNSKKYRFIDKIFKILGR